MGTLIRFVALVLVTVVIAGSARPYTVEIARGGLDHIALSPSPHLPATDLTQRVLNVPLYHQAHRLSCEAAALRMALAYEGISTFGKEPQAEGDSAQASGQKQQNSTPTVTGTGIVKTETESVSA